MKELSHSFIVFVFSPAGTDVSWRQPLLMHSSFDKYMNIPNNNELCGHCKLTQNN